MTTAIQRRYNDDHAKLIDLSWYGEIVVVCGQDREGGHVLKGMGHGTGLAASLPGQVPPGG
jgi:hypothetical protein